MRLELREVIRQMVESILDEGGRRDAYIDRLVDAMKGAFGEYAKARYAETNVALRRKAGRGTVEGWDRETEDRLVYDVTSAMARRLKTRDKKKAFEEACAELRELVPHYLRAAKRKVAATFEVDEDRLSDPPDAVTDEFFARLNNLFDEIDRP
jgi:hypothetical protein